MTTVLLDTHVVHRWSAEPGRLSQAASGAIEAADVLAVAAISWFELAWLAANGRVVTTVPLRSWIDRLAEHVVTLPIDPATGAAAVALPDTLPGDPADRLIYATATLRAHATYGCLVGEPDPGPRRDAHGSVTGASMPGCSGSSMRTRETTRWFTPSTVPQGARS